MSVLQRGDRVVVSELSRLGRSLGQIVAILDTLAKAGVVFVALKENIHVDGKHDIQTKVMTTLFALFAEVERDLISERTREGLAKAKSSGRKLGRPKGSLGVSRLDGKEDDIRHFLELETLPPRAGTRGWPGVAGSRSGWLRVFCAGLVRRRGDQRPACSRRGTGDTGATSDRSTPHSDPDSQWRPGRPPLPVVACIASAGTR